MIYKSRTLQRLAQAGLIYDLHKPSDLDKHLTQSRCIYVGFDLTNNDLAIGAYAMIRACQILHEEGHIIFILLGTFTSLIGDPGDKLHRRQNKDVMWCARGILKTLKKHLPFAKIVYNHRWLSGITLSTYLAFLKSYTLNQFLRHSYINDRLGKALPIGLDEFLYATLQGYDFIYLYDKYNVTVQLGGQDQIINMLKGIVHNDHLYYIASPLLLDGSNKISKTTHPELLLNIGVYRLKYALYNLRHETLNTICRWLLPSQMPIEKKEQVDMITSHITKQGLTPIYHTLDQGVTLIDLLFTLLWFSKAQIKRLIQQRAIIINGITMTNNIQVQKNTAIVVAKKIIIKII